MKKYVLIFTILFTQFSLCAQTEYIDIAKVGLIGTSTMAIYSGDVLNDDLSVFKLNIFNKNEIYHWVKYTNLSNDKVVLTMSDDEDDYRQICFKHGKEEYFCKVFPSFASSYEFTTKQDEFQIWISKPNVKYY